MHRRTAAAAGCATPGTRGTSGALLAATVRRRVGFAALEEYARRNPRPLLNYLGRLVSRTFVDPKDPGGAMKPFKGLVTAFDPADLDKTYEVVYEDGDAEWMSAATLRPLLTDGPQGADVMGLVAMRALVAPAA